jgi:zinc finger SWIM domain-containing protein 3
MEIQQPVLKLGDQFDSWLDVQPKVEEYQTSNYVQLWRRGTRKLESVKHRYPNRVFKPELQYYEIGYNCVHGGRTHRSKSGGDRSSKTYRQDCPFALKFRASKDGQKLEVVILKEEHSHELNKAIFSHYPAQRRLDAGDKEHVSIEFYDFLEDTSVACIPKII